LGRATRVAIILIATQISNLAVSDQPATQANSIVCIGVCTIKRPAMLSACLSSLAAQKNLETVVHIIVVDNDDIPSSEKIAEESARTSRFPIHYRHEPQRGISMARNRVLEEALRLRADWLAFIDDDETADPDWLENLLRVADRDSADVVQPLVRMHFAEPAPFWYFGREEKTRNKDGPLQVRLLKSASTGGTLMSARLFRRDGMNLRFDEQLAFGGQEDEEFYGAAYLLGARIVRSSLPAVTETLHPSRYTYSRYALRGLAQGGSFAARYRQKNGFVRAVRRYTGVSFARAARGLLQLLIAPVFIPFALRRFKFTALEGGRNLMFAAGAIGGVFRLQYAFYRRIDGR
jgi:succinoglycan biosynthesis protein ExoM